MKANDLRRKTPKQLQREKAYGWEEPNPWKNQTDGTYDDFFDGPSTRF